VDGCKCHPQWEALPERWELWNTLQVAHETATGDRVGNWDDSHDVATCGCSLCRWLAASSLVDNCANVVHAISCESRRLCLLAKATITTGEMDALDLAVEDLQRAGCEHIVLLLENGREVDLIHRHDGRRV
jgi:hypothetical protein